MGANHTSGPLYVGGVPVLPGQQAVFARGLLMGGIALFVCNRTGVVAGDGRSADRPMTSIESALSKLGGRTGWGDCIYVLPGHAENVDEADWASETGAASGFSVCGVGAGLLRPSLTWTIATSTWLLDTDNVEIANMRLFLAGADAAGSALTVAAPITVSGNGCRIVDCDIKWGYDADQIVGDAIIWTGDDGLFANNRAFAAVAAVPSNTFLTLTGADRMRIAYNWIKGPTDGTTRGVIDTETTACTDLLGEYNYLCNSLASSTIAWSSTANDTGVLRDNRVFVDSGILPFTASELEWYQNYVVNDEGEAGALVGTASA